MNLSNILFCNTLFVSVLCVFSSFASQKYPSGFKSEMELKMLNSHNKVSENNDSTLLGLFWDFNKWNDTEGWFIPNQVKGANSGGTICFSVNPGNDTTRFSSWSYQVWGEGIKYDIESPKGLNISTEEYNAVKMRILNNSPETDGFIYWRTRYEPDVNAGQARFTMKPDFPDWQEVTCYFDDSWDGIIDQLRIKPGQMGTRGEIYIDWIKIVNCLPEENAPRPDICSNKVVPTVNLPNISQEDFKQAFDVLDECMVTDVPMQGFNYPFLAPGGKYGHSWWQLDGSLNMAGAKWANQEFVENMIRGFAGVQNQNPDGRIDLWGGSPMRGVPANVSSLPYFFESAFDVATRTHDRNLQELIYDMMKKYLSYWLSPLKRDAETGLITAVFEESFSDESFGDKNALPGTLAPVDLNIVVAAGCFNTSLLAEYLGKKDEVQIYSEMYNQISFSINKYLWNEEQGGYYNYDVLENKLKPRLICTTFYPMRLAIAPEKSVEKMIQILKDPNIFNWGIRPVTSIAKTEAEFMEATGTYDGTAWFGDIWTLRNMTIISGLEDVGKHDVAAELNWATITMFNNNYYEYIVPSTGSGEGVERYGWSASQYIQAIIEHLFGINYNSFEKKIRIFPHIPAALLDKEIEIKNVIIPAEEELRIDLKIKKKKKGETHISIKTTGEFYKTDLYLEVCLPDYPKKKILVKNGDESQYKSVSQINNLTNASGIKMEMEKNIEIIFE